MTQPTTIEAPRPEPPPFAWPSQDLKNLLQLAPVSPYTRALLRIKFNRPVPENCQTFEQIENWLATLPLILPPSRYPVAQVRAWQGNSEYERQRREIDNGEFLTVTGRIEGYEYRKEYWTKETDVKVPLSVFEEGEDAFRDYIEERVRDSDADYGDSDYADGGEDDGLEIDEDFEELMERAEEMIAQRDN